MKGSWGCVNVPIDIIVILKGYIKNCILFMSALFSAYPVNHSYICNKVYKHTFERDKYVHSSVDLTKLSLIV